MSRLAHIGLWLVCFAGAAGAEPASRVLARAEALMRSGNLEGARELLTAARAQNPEDAEIRYQLGYVLFRERRLDLAKKEFETVVKLAPPAPHSRYYLGRIALLENRPKEAAAYLEAAAHADPPILDAPAQLVKAYTDSRQFDAAADAIQPLIRQTPWDGALHYQLGRIYQQLGRAALAREEFETSRRLKSTDREVVESLLKFSQHLSKGEKDPAVQIYNRLTSDERLDPDVLIALGVLLANANLENEALHTFKIAARKQPEMFQAQYNEGLALLKLGRFAEARTPLAAAARLLPESFDANSALALAYLGEERHAEAIEPLEAAYRLRPGNSKIAGLLASSYLRTGKAGKAIEVLREARAQSTGDPKLSFLLIEALQANHDDAGALEIADDMVRRFPEDPQANLFLAQEMLRAGRYREAGTPFETAARLDPHNVEARLGLGEVLQKKGDLEGSLRRYREALALDPHNLSAQLGSSRDLALLKRFPEAREFLEGAVAEHPENAALRFELARVYARLGDTARAAEQTRIFQQLHEEEAQ